MKHRARSLTTLTTFSTGSCFRARTCSSLRRNGSGRLLGEASWSPKKWWNQRPSPPPPQSADRIFVKGAEFSDPSPLLGGAVLPVDIIMTEVLPAMAPFTSAPMVLDGAAPRAAPATAPAA